MRGDYFAKKFLLILKILNLRVLSIFTLGSTAGPFLAFTTKVDLALLDGHNLETNEGM